MSRTHISLSEADAALLDEYFLLLCHQLRDRQTQLYRDIVRSLVGTVLLKILSLQHDNSLEADKGDDVTTLHGKQLVDRFTDMTMQQIANDLNFANPSFFGKYFKDHAGMTPMAFRMKYQKT